MRIPGVGRSQGGQATLGVNAMEDERKARRQASKQASRELTISAVGQGLNALSNVGRTVADFQSIAAREREGAADRELAAAINTSELGLRRDLDRSETGRLGMKIKSDENIFTLGDRGETLRTGMVISGRAREGDEDRRVTTEQAE